MRDTLGYSGTGCKEARDTLGYGGTGCKGKTDVRVQQELESAMEKVFNIPHCFLRNKNHYSFFLLSSYHV